jgi:hypothetical protein
MGGGGNRKVWHLWLHNRGLKREAIGGELEVERSLQLQVPLLHFVIKNFELKVKCTYNCELVLVKYVQYVQ